MGISHIDDENLLMIKTQMWKLAYVGKSFCKRYDFLFRF